jgi:beta-phosphoglucomutase-like phosphatase (HAD superfamily)
VPLRAIVFDFDGVLANSEPLHLRAYQEILSEEGLTLTEQDYYARYLGFDDVAAFRAMGADRGHVWSDADIKRLVAVKAQRLEALEQHVSILFPGAAEAVRRTAAELPIAIASGALGAEVRRVLVREQLMNCFAAIVTAEETAHSKPSPEPYLEAVARLMSATSITLEPGDCVAIEDSPWGLQSAQRAGLRTVAVAHSYKEHDLLSADLVIQNIAAFDLHRLSLLYCENQ